MLATPVCPLVIPTGMTELRGPVTVDPDTGSSISTSPTTYVKKDQCDQPSTIKFSANMQLVQLGGTSGCEKVPAASVSISGFVPACATDADIDLIVNKVRDKIKEGF